MDPLSVVVLDLVKAMQPALPSDFRRRGRKWIRSASGLSQEIGLRRLIMSYNFDAAIVRLNVSFGSDQCLHGSDWVGNYWAVERELWKQPHEWWVRADTPAATLANITSEINSALGPVLEFLDEQFTQDGYLRALEARGVTFQVLDAYLEFGRTADVQRVLSLLQPTRGDRENDIRVARAVIDAFRALDQPVPNEWHNFAVETVKAFRGRPPKYCRDVWQSVRDDVNVARRATSPFSNT